MGFPVVSRLALSIRGTESEPFVCCERANFDAGSGMFLRRQTSQFHEVASKTDLEGFIAVDWNGNADWAASLAVNVMAPIDAL
jgi:hypothetical protein